MAQTSQRAIPVILVIVVVALLAARAARQFMKSEPEAQQGLVRWVKLDEAMKLSASTNKPILFDFTAEWCPPCHMLDAEVFQDPELARQINERFVPVRVVDRQREEGKNTPAVDELQRRYDVDGFPIVIIASSSLAERARMEGFRGKAGFVTVMESVR